MTSNFFYLGSHDVLII